MEIFDCNCSIGSGPIPAWRYARNVAELREELDFCGIDRALVHHANMRFSSPQAWNVRFSEQVQRYAWIEPVWAIMPSQTGEQQKPELFIKAMKGAGVRTLWAFPKEHKYALNRSTFGSLFDSLSERNIPLFVKDDLFSIGNLLAEFPRLIVVAVNQGPGSLERMLRPLLDEYPNLYLETSTYIIDGLIEEFCERHGCERLLFGSGFPNNCSGSALLRLTQAEIDPASKQAIAAGNLKRLLEGVQL
ncbi:MAG: amidohydrolase family protein [Firmicutes bacterium]|nr:amidohydrolase family protein [Bacillota bacterium]